MSTSSTHYHVDHLLGGLCGGFVSTVFVHPLDFLKVRFQVNEGTPSSIQAHRPQYRGYIHAIQSIVRSQGITGLYQGATPNLMGTTVAWGLYFQFYNVVKAKMRTHADEDLSSAHHMLAGVVAGSFTLALTNPLWVVKTRLCLQYENDVRLYKGVTDCLVKIYRTEGVKGWYKGFVPGLIGTSHGALQFMLYDALKYQYCKRNGLPTTTKLDSQHYLTFAAISKVIAVTATYPYQVLRSRLQDQHVQYKGVVDCLLRTFRAEGLEGFYKGILAGIARVTPATCITFVVYEQVAHLGLATWMENRVWTPTSSSKGS